MKPTDFVAVKAQCHCGVSTFQVRFDKSLIPFDNHLCHCNTCRHVSGHMAFYYVPIQDLPLVGSLHFRTVNQSKDLTGYRTSRNAVRYFCPVCSAHMFQCINKTDWYVAGGSLDDTMGIARVQYHLWIEETMDGGMANQLRKIGGHRLPRFSRDEDSVELPLNWRSEKLPTKEEAKKAEHLEGYCHCSAIRFYITRPNIMSTYPHASYPDLLFPLNQTRLATIRNVKDEKWWLFPPVATTETGQLIKLGPHEHDPDNEDAIPTSETKFLAGHCVCSRCRLGGGFEIQSWTYVSRANVIEVGSEEPIELAHEADRPKGLRQYSSSPGKYREFCSTCGATAFWWHANRPDLIAVAIGLIDQSKDGVRAEEWLKWHKERLSFIENGKMSSGAVQGLKEGMASESDPELEVATEVISQN